MMSSFIRKRESQLFFDTDLFSLTIFHTIVELCTLPFQSVAGGCYYYSFETGVIVDSYQAAEDLCNEHGGHLAVVDTEDKNTAIKECFFGAGGKQNKLLTSADLIHRLCCFHCRLFA